MEKKEILKQAVKALLLKKKDLKVDWAELEKAEMKLNERKQ